MSARGEPVDPGGDRCVRREHLRGSCGFDGLFEAQAVVADRAADPLQREERGVALVHVEHLRAQPERLEEPDPADAEKDLLADPLFGVASVETIGDRAPELVVLGHVGVEKVELDPTDVDAPARARRSGPRQDQS